jgi:hypothetical protein
VDTGGGQWEFLASDALHLAYPGVGIEFGYGEKLVAGLFDGVFHPQPIEQRALGPLLAGGDFNQASDEMSRITGRRFLTYDRANQWSDPFTSKPEIGFHAKQHIFPYRTKKKTAQP